MNPATDHIPGPYQPLPAPTPGPAAVSLALDLSTGEAACLAALAARWRWQAAHVAAYLLHEQLVCRYLDDQEPPGGEVAP
ncbi:MAG: hypothetical protein KAX64_03710 [Chromatiaceae bacterium]|nr:hypothetical protein [Chromatiaceae bacterium]MBP8282950.1 hypothetical protein [Chromatiaceae bacterium]